MKVQVIEREGEPEYAVLPWAHYQALLRAASHALQPTPAAIENSCPPLTQLTSWREAKNLSVEQLARSVGISPHYLGLIESGERQPDAAIQRALAWHLGVQGWESAS